MHLVSGALVALLLSWTAAAAPAERGCADADGSCEASSELPGPEEEEDAAVVLLQQPGGGGIVMREKAEGRGADQHDAEEEEKEEREDIEDDEGPVYSHIDSSMLRNLSSHERVKILSRMEDAGVPTLALSDSESQSDDESDTNFIFERRRRRRRRRRQNNLLDRKCWYQLWDGTDWGTGEWLQYEMGTECDDLTNYDSGSWVDRFSSGGAGAASGCTLTMYASASCSGSSLVWADASSKSNPVSKFISDLSDSSINFNNKITSIKCAC